MMQPQNFTNIHRAELVAIEQAARAQRVAEADRANALAATLPPTGDLDWDIKLWIKAGKLAGIACLWFMFIAPILMVLHLWD